MAFAERQDARSSNYRQSTRLTRTEVDRDSPRHIDDAERLRCDANDYFAVGTVPPSRDTPRQIRRLNMEQLPANIGSRSRKRPFTRTAAPDPHFRRSRLLLRHLKAGQSSHTLRLPDRCRRSLPDAYAGKNGIEFDWLLNDPAPLRVHAPRLQSAAPSEYRHTCYSHRSISGAKTISRPTTAMSSEWNRASASRRGN
jgi:hypothetical protein